MVAGSTGPRWFERESPLSDRRTALVRPIVPGDQGQLARAIRTAYPDTVHRRFLVPGTQAGGTMVHFRVSSGPDAAPGRRVRVEWDPGERE